MAFWGRRRHFIIRKKLQERFTTILLLQMVSILLVIAGFSYYWNIEQRKILLNVIGTPDADLIYQSMQWFLVKTILLIGAAAVVLIVFGILASHKIAGPVYKMEQLLAGIQRGDYRQKIQFRRSDHLDELAETLNRATASLEEAQRMRFEKLGLMDARMASVEAFAAGVEHDRHKTAAALEDMKVVLGNLSSHEA